MRTSAALSRRLTCLSVTGALSAILWVSSPAPPLFAQGTEVVASNDNRRSAGTLVDNIYTLRLEARLGEWRPDGESGLPLTVRAFAVEGGPLQIPAPLVRVVAGTQIRAIIRNRLSEPLAVHGFYTRPGRTGDAIQIPAGETREVRFAAGVAGTYYYWAAGDTSTPLPQRPGADTQLTGAFVVDPVGATTVTDRVLLITNWTNDVALGEPGFRNRFVINGRSWPATERLTYEVGETVRMRVINAGAAVHPMHLHGFYFRVDSRGVEERDTLFAADSSPRMAVTERLAPGQSFSLTWNPTRPGNWLFHCHDNVHLDFGGNLDGTPVNPIPHSHVRNHALEMMAGPVMGITVTGTSTEAVAEPSVERRQLRLIAREDEGGTPLEPAFGYTLEDGRNVTPSQPPYLPGPIVILKKNEPVSITVVNRLAEPTAVHWHGIELESYYDGVPDFAGEGQRIAPSIPPGGTFDARFTPPRSGTFIYHTHLDDTRQQRAGLSGALLVVDDPAAYDPTHDLVMLVTVPRKVADNDVVLLNGSASPPLRELRVGETYRFRFINVHTFRPSMRMRLLRDTTLQRWRVVAKDGMDLPEDLATEGPSEIQMGNGETYDFHYVPTAAGDYRLDITQGDGRLLTSMPIRMR